MSSGITRLGDCKVGRRDPLKEEFVAQSGKLNLSASGASSAQENPSWQLLIDRMNNIKIKDKKIKKKSEIDY